MSDSIDIKISIIVPVYNVEEYLNECIDSLVYQTLKSVEIILVDDGSTDKSGIICDEYAKKYDNIYVLHQNNGGQSRARNRGMDLAKGDYILFVDSDDYIINNACEVLYSYAINNNVDIVWGDMINSPDSTEFNRAERFPSYLKVSKCQTMLMEALDVHAYDIVPWLRLIKRDILKKNDLKFLDGCYYEDQEFTLKMHLLDEVTMLRVNFPFYYYRPNRLGSITNIHGLNKGIDFIKVIHKMIEYIENIELDINVKDYAENVVAMAVYHLSTVFVFMKKNDCKILLSMLDKRIYKYSKKTNHLTTRMKIQNRLFIFHIYYSIYML